MTDVLAQAEQQRSAATQRPDRAAEQRAIDPNADPFATPDSVLGGGGKRGPGWADLLGRLVVLKPIEKKVDQPVPNQPNQTQDFWSCDLTVLDGGKLTIVTPAKPASGDQPELPEQRNEYDPPETFPAWFAYGKAITIKLDNLGATPLYLGVVQRCPTGPEYRKGMTWQQKTAEWDAYVAKVQADPARAGAKPQFSWGLVDPTPEQRAAALAWYRAQA
jgi:hypothetical protein